MSDLLNLIHREIERAMTGRNTKRYGVVTSYDPDKGLAKVKMQPEGHETGWLPIRTAHMGNGFGMAVGLTAGDQVSLEPQEGSSEAFAISGTVHSSKDKPPKAESGELVIRHKSGSQIHLDKSGNIKIHANAKLEITVEGNASVTVQGTTSISSQGSVTLHSEGDVNVTSGGMTNIN